MIIDYNILNEDRISSIQSNENLNLFSKLSTQDDDLLNPYDNIDISCKYRSMTESFHHMKTNVGLKVLSWNIHSLNSKFNEFLDFLKEYENNDCIFDLIIIQESWKVKNPNSLQLDGYNFLYKTRVESEGGGVAFYINKNLKFREKSCFSIFEEKIFESLCVEIEVNKKEKVLISNVYRSNCDHPQLTPLQQTNRFLDIFANLQDQISSYNTEAYIFGDFNFDLLKFEQNINIRDLMENSFSNGFLELISLPTRVTQATATLIDHVYTNSNKKNFDSSIILSDISDHFPILTIMNDKKKCKKSSYAYVRNFNDQSLDAFKVELQNINWDQLYAENDAQRAYEIFHEIFNAAYDRHFPLKKIKLKKNKHFSEDFMTKGLITSRKQKFALTNKKIKHPTEANVNKYKEYRNLYNKLIRSAKQLHYKLELEKNKNDLKKTWQILKDAIRMKKDKSLSIQEINYNDVIINDDEKIADKFNEHFTTIADKITDDINPSDKNCTDFLRNTNLNFTFRNVYAFEIKEIIQELKSKTSFDMYGMSNIFIKKITDQLIFPLRHIFNLSLQTGVIPTKLKIAKVIPIYKLDKKDSKFTENMNNYRPISLLPILSKILEKLVANRLSRFLNENNVLYSHQYGFQSKRSTLHPIMHFLNKITEASNKKYITIGVFCDLQKAFDCCSHRILLAKLKKYGVKDNELLWFENYLKNRQQFVSVNEGKSTMRNISKGVPQGSILGPLLFLIYINDLADCTSLYTLLFADDTSFLISGKDIKSVVSKLNKELHKICYWFRSNELSLHALKTKYMIFTKNSSYINFDDINVNLNYNNETENNPELIHRLTCANTQENPTIKFLGVYIDPKLDFKYHIEHMHAKISRSLYAINTAKHFLNTEILIILYKSLIHCHFLYCIQIYSSVSSNAMKKLFLQQKKAIRIVTNSRFNSHTVPLFKKYEILPIDEQAKHSKILFMYDYIHNKLPNSFHETWKRNHQRQQGIMQLRNANHFHIPFIRLETYMKFPIAEIPKLWNEIVIDKELDDNVSRKLFSDEIKAFFLDNLELVCSRANCPECS